MSWVFGPGGTTATPGGADKDIQFNNNGEFSGSSLLTTDGSGSLSASTHVSASTFYGDGSNLTGVTASAVQVADGPQYSLQFRFDSPVSGDLSGSSDLLWDPATSDVLISGNVRLEDGKEFYGDLEGAILFVAKVDEVGGIGKGKVVYIKGLSGTTPTIGLAACDDPAKMPAFGLCAISASNNANTQVATFGSLDGLNLNNISPGHSFSEGDVLYVNTGSGGTAGTFTNIKPTGSNNLVQNIGKVVRNGASSNGQIKVGGAGRANDTPNLDKGHIFVGNETDQAIQDNTIFISASAERVGINITAPTAALHVSASSVHGGESARFEGQVVITSPDGELVVQDTTNNKQVRVTADILPTIEFGDNTDTDDFFLIQGGATSKIQVDAGLAAFIIATSSAGTGGFIYKPAQERVGIHTPAPTHDFTVNGNTAVSGTTILSASAADGQDIFVGSGTTRTIGVLIDGPDDFFVMGHDAGAVTLSASQGVEFVGGSEGVGSFGSDIKVYATQAGNITKVTLSAAGDISGSGNITGSQVHVEDAFVSSVPADRVLVSTTNGKITSHSPFTFSSDVLSVPTITASVGIQTEALEVSSSDNGSINIGEGISYVQNGVDRLDIFENEFKFQNVNLYQGVSTENTSNFNIRDKQVFLVDTNSSVVTGTLPGVNSSDDYGVTFTIKDSGGNANTNNVVIEPSGSQKIDGGTAAKIATNYGAMTVVAISSSTNGLGWGIVSAT